MDHSPTHSVRVDFARRIINADFNRPESPRAVLPPVTDWETVTAVICKQAPLLIAQGRHRTLAGRLRRLPQPVMREMPELLYWRGMCFLPHDPHQSRNDFEEAFALFRSKHDIPGIFSSWAGIVEAILETRRDYSALEVWLAVLDDLMKLHPGFPVTEVEARVTATALCALTLHQPHHTAIIATWEARARRLLQHGQETDQQFALAGSLMLNYLSQGAFAKAGHIADRLTPLVEKAGLPARLAWWAREAALGWLSGAGQRCKESVAKGMAAAQGAGMYSTDFDLYAQGTHGALSTGDLAVAGECLARMNALLDNGRRLDVSVYYFLSAWDALCRGDIPRAADQSRTALMAAGEAGVPHQQALCHAMLAQASFEHGDRRGVGEHLLCLRRMARDMKSAWLEYLGLILETQFCFLRRLDQRALKALYKSLSLGRKYGYAAIPGMRPCMMAMLCKKALDNGIEVEYVRDIIRRHDLRPPCPPVECENWPWPVKIYTLGRFAMVVEGEMHPTGRQAQGKPSSLLKALISFGGREVSETRLIGALWPDAEGDAACQVFRITLHRLRQMLGSEKAIHVHDGNVTLDDSYCWVDAWAFECLTDKARQSLSSALSEKALKLYQGHFLAKDDDEAWALSLRERLRNKFLRHVECLGQRFERAGEWDSAIDCYRKGLEVDVLAEVLYQRLIACYQRQGRRAEAMAVYQRCRTMFSALLGVEPSTRVWAL